MSKKLVLIRHGESVIDDSDADNSTLTPLGREFSFCMAWGHPLGFLRQEAV